MVHECDIAVIGAGPAGMAAAIRARWMRAPGSAPARVVLFDPAGFGGIARMGAIYLTGPSFGFIGHDLVRKLRADVELLEIPLLREAVSGLQRTDAGWQVETPLRTVACTAVVLATGLRRLSREIDLTRTSRLIHLTGGYRRAVERITDWSREHTDCHLVIIGGEPLAASLPLFRQLDAGRNRLEAICEPRQGMCRLRREEEHAVISVGEMGETREIVCDQVMLDYHSLEMAPSSLAFLSPALRTAVGYCAVGPAGVPMLPGLFAAGDCAGAPCLCLKALAEGSLAGDHAYRCACAPSLLDIDEVLLPAAAYGT